MLGGIGRNVPTTPASARRGRAAAGVVGKCDEKTQPYFLWYTFFNKAALMAKKNVHRTLYIDSHISRRSPLFIRLYIYIVCIPIIIV